jgi:hypothetical protein
MIPWQLLKSMMFPDFPDFQKSGHPGNNSSAWIKYELSTVDAQRRQTDGEKEQKICSAPDISLFRPLSAFYLIDLR